MFNFFKNLFKKKPELYQNGLEEAKEKNLISEEEFLELKSGRANRELENYRKNKKLKEGSFLRRGRYGKVKLPPSTNSPS